MYLFRGPSKCLKPESGVVVVVLGRLPAQFQWRAKLDQRKEF